LSRDVTVASSAVRATCIFARQVVQNNTIRPTRIQSTQGMVLVVAYRYHRHRWN
jgi:hypothetical protein